MILNDANSTEHKCEHCGCAMVVETELVIGDPRTGNYNRWTSYRCGNDECRNGYVDHLTRNTGKS